MSPLGLRLWAGSGKGWEWTKVKDVVHETLFSRVYRACKEWRGWTGRRKFFELMDFVREMMVLTIQEGWFPAGEDQVVGFTLRVMRWTWEDWGPETIKTGGQGVIANPATYSKVKASAGGFDPVLVRPNRTCSKHMNYTGDGYRAGFEPDFRLVTVFRHLGGDLSI